LTSGWRFAAALSALLPHHTDVSAPPRHVTRLSARETRAVRARRFIGVCSYRDARVCARCCYARNVFNFSEPRNHIAQMHVQACVPPGGRYRGEYSGYNGCCEHLRFSACETSFVECLKELSERAEQMGYRGQWTERVVS